MKTSEAELIKNYIQDRRNKVGNFDLKVQTSTVLFNFFKTKGYSFYFTPKLNLKNGHNSLSKNPDFHAQKSGKNDVLGEIKQSLSAPVNSENRSEISPEELERQKEIYDKILSKDLRQLEEYNQEFVGISTPHDVFLSAPSWCNEAIAHYISKIDVQTTLKNKVIVLKYHWMKGDSHNKLVIQKVYGNFSDSDINKEFQFKDYVVGEGDLTQIQGYYKIFYTEEEYNETPVEYLMLILWHNIIPELIESADYKQTVERLRKGENTLEFSLDELMEIIDELYTLKNSNSNTVKQFSRDMIMDAMNAFHKMGKAQKLDDSKTNPRYRITHTKLAKIDLLDFLISELNKEEFEERAKIELRKMTNKDLTQIPPKDSS